MGEVSGLDPVANTVYRAILKHSSGSLDLIAEETRLSSDQLEEALERMERMGLIRPAQSHPVGIRPLPPEAAISSLLAAREAELAAKQHQLAMERAAAARLIAEYAEFAPPFVEQPSVDQLTGLDEIREFLTDLSWEAEEEVLTFAPQGAHQPESIAAAKPLDERLRDRGVKVRTVYLDSARRHAPTAEYLGWLTQQGSEVRTVATLPVRMVIFDRRVAVLPTDAADSAQGAMVVRAQGMLAAFCGLFEAIWPTATQFASRPVRDQRGLTPQESAALHMLSKGMTDGAIAKRLGVSPRTARRIAADLMLGLEATSRFQAGLHAAQRGWLPTP
ncbi:LuxR C-terminal-related transcriptional regulator [Streptomyces avermitilis]|uniref:LuxR C-terminal-related transcriptional regulator n=1 Tax=Streptomyces avermitilis TaxID=33903 RepID=UPI00380BBCC5